MWRGPRWATDELRSRRSVRRGQRFGDTLHAPGNGAPEPPGELERYFDAHVEGLGIFKWRHYFPIYERHLQGFRDRDVHLVEIGVFSGGSLGMWRHYSDPIAS